jgi:hypothetical protein
MADKTLSAAWGIHSILYHFTKGTYVLIMSQTFLKNVRHQGIRSTQCLANLLINFRITLYNSLKKNMLHSLIPKPDDKRGMNTRDMGMHY